MRHANTNQEKAGTARLTPDKADLRTRITGDRQGRYC